MALSEQDIKGEEKPRAFGVFVSAPGKNRHSSLSGNCFTLRARGPREPSRHRQAEISLFLHLPAPCASRLPSLRFLAPLRLAHGWGQAGQGGGLRGSTRLPGARQQGRGSHSFSGPGWGEEAAKTPPAASRARTTRPSNSPGSRPFSGKQTQDLLFPEIFRFSGHSLALPEVRCALAQKSFRC